MFMRLSVLIFFACMAPALASAPPDLKQRAFSLNAALVFNLAKKEMPLPVIAVAALQNQGKLQFIIKMSTARLSWAKEPVIRITFEITDDIDIENAMHDASILAKAFITAAERDAILNQVAFAGGANYASYLKSR
jgi:hypothetical protein